MSFEDIEIPTSGEQSMKKSKLLELYDKYIVAPLKYAIFKSEAKTQYADVIVRNSNGDILLLKRSTQDNFAPGTWCLPGGHIEKGEEALSAAIRECFEETGIHLNSARLVHVESRSDSQSSYYEAIVNNDDMVSMILDNDEHYNWMWTSLSDLDKYELILDLGKVLKQMLVEGKLAHIESISRPFSQVQDIFYKIDEQYNIVKKAFDEGLLTEEQFIEATDNYKKLKVQKSIEVVTAAFDEGQVDEETFIRLVSLEK